MPGAQSQVLRHMARSDLRCCLLQKPSIARILLGAAPGFLDDGLDMIGTAQRMQPRHLRQGHGLHVDRIEALGIAKGRAVRLIA